MDNRSGNRLPSFQSGLTPMRFLRLFLLLLPSLIQAGPLYSLETLFDRAAQHRAPKVLQKAMAALESERLAECAKEIPLTAEQRGSYFSAVRLELGNRRMLSYLVFPSRSCGAFSEESAITFWIVTRNPNGSYSSRYSARGSSVEVLQTRSNGWRDIATFDGDTRTHLRFNGKQYERVAE